MVEMTSTSLDNNSLNQRMAKSSSLPGGPKSLIKVKKMSNERAMLSQSGKGKIDFELFEQ